MLKVGAASLDITPANPCHLSGYAARQQPSIGVHDPVFAKAVVMDDGGAKVAVVSCDLLGFTPAFSDRLRERLREEAGIPHSIVACTHTHSGPAPMDLVDCGDLDSSWLADAADKIVQCAVNAQKQMVECRVRCAVGRADVAMNRRAKIGEQTVLLATVDQRPPEVPPGPVDPSLPVAQFVDKQGNAVAVLFGYACHAVCLGHENRLISADYPGAACAALSRDRIYGLPVFLQGACGDVNPAVYHRSFDSADAVGQAVAGSVADALRTAPTLDASQLRFAERRLKLPLKGVNTCVDAAVSALSCGAFAVATLPGEAFVELGMRVRAGSPFKVTFIAGYANGNVGYIPTRSAYEEGGYEVDSAYRYYGYEAPLAPDAGEMVVNAALECLTECAEGLYETGG
ncbi:MAG: neutral/alkaline non-lysosomal ceramidase N-terminal domain-containing protein [Armatimonadota bacterium]